MNKSKKKNKITKKKTKIKFRKNTKKYNLTSKKYKADNLRQITLKNYKYGGSKLKAKVRDLIKKTKKNNSSQSSSKPQPSKNIDEEEKKRLAIIKLQNLARTKKTEKENLDKKKEEEAREAAIKIQNLARRKSAKDILKEKKEDKKIQDAKGIIGKAMLKHKNRKTSSEENDLQEAVPELHRPTEARPELPRPEQVRPELPRPEQVTPELPRPEQVRPELPRPEQVRPELPRPEQVTPELPRPEQVRPELPRPEQVRPELPRPEQVTPELPRPEQVRPELPRPEQVRPELPMTEETRPEEQVRPELPITEEARPELPRPEQVRPELPMTEETRPEEPRPIEATPELPRPEEATPELPMPEEDRPEEPKPEEPKPEEARPEEPKPEEPKPEEPYVEPEKISNDEILSLWNILTNSLPINQKLEKILKVFPRRIIQNRNNPLIEKFLNKAGLDSCKKISDFSQGLKYCNPKYNALIDSASKEGNVQLITPLVFESSVIKDDNVNFVSFSKLIRCINNTPSNSEIITCEEPKSEEPKPKPEEPKPEEPKPEEPYVEPEKISNDEILSLWNILTNSLPINQKLEKILKVFPRRIIQNRNNPLIEKFLNKAGLDSCKKISDFSQGLKYCNPKYNALIDSASKEGNVQLITPLVFESSVIKDDNVNFVSFSKLIRCINNTPSNSEIITCEEPKSEEPKPEEPKSEEPKPEEPKPEEPKPEEPKPEEPKPEEPKPEEPKPEEPKPEEPKPEEPKPEEPKPEEPKPEEPKPEEPKPEEPKPEEPKPEEPKPEEPKPEEPKPQESKPQEPKVEAQEIPSDMDETFTEYQKLINENKVIEKEIEELKKKIQYYNIIINQFGKQKRDKLSIDDLAKLKHAENERSKLQKKINILYNKQKEIKNLLLRNKFSKEHQDISQDSDNQVNNMLSKKQEIQSIISQIEVLQKEIISEQEKIESNIKNVNQDLRGDLKNLLKQLQGEYKNLEMLAFSNKGLDSKSQYYFTLGKGNNGSTRLVDIQGPIGINANELISLLNSSFSNS